MWLGLAPRTDRQLSGIDTSKWDGRLRRVQGGGREQQCHVHTRPSGHAPVGRSPAVSAGDNTLHTGVGGRREATPQMGLEGPRRQSKRGSLFPGWTPAVDVGATTFTLGQCMARSNLNHAKWQGRDEGSRREIRSSTARAPGGILCDAPLLQSPSSLCGRVGAGAGSPSGACWVEHGGGVWSSVLERSAGRVAGWGLGGSWLLGVRRVSSEPHAHSCDKGGPLAAAVFRQEEGHGTLW